MSTSDKTTTAIQTHGQEQHITAEGLQAEVPLCPGTARLKPFPPKDGSHSTAQRSKNADAAVSERNRPISTKEMVETAMDRGMLQKMRSTIERCRKP